MSDPKHRILFRIFAAVRQMSTSQSLLTEINGSVTFRFKQILPPLLRITPFPAGH